MRTRPELVAPAAASRSQESQRGSKTDGSLEGSPRGLAEQMLRGNQSRRARGVGLRVEHLNMSRPFTPQLVTGVRSRFFPAPMPRTPGYPMLGMRGFHPFVVLPHAASVCSSHVSASSSFEKNRVGHG